MTAPYMLRASRAKENEEESLAMPLKAATFNIVCY